MLSRILIKDDTGNYNQFTPSPPEDAFAVEYKTIRPLPEKIGKGHFTSFTINKGMGMGICSGRFDRDYTAQLTSKNPLIFFVFCIKGHAFSRNSCQSDPVIMAPGRAATYFFEDPVYEREIRGEQELLSLVLRVSPDLIGQLLNLSPHRDANDLKTVEKILGNGFFHTDNPMTSQMKLTLFQILNNPHQGRVGKIYLESKALELIAFKLEQIFQTDCRPKRNVLLTPGERELIIHARDILVSRLQDPPSLRELAGQIGMSHVRLSRGFRMVFGCTVFEYLRKERLSYARMLIEEKPVDLTWVAYESGFCSSSHFAASFFKEYGLNPSEYRKSISGFLPKTS